MSTDSSAEARALRRREAILSAITQAAERFLWASAQAWPQTVQEVIAQLGTQLSIGRIFLCKHQAVTAEYVITGLRYEWVATGGLAKIGQDKLRQFSLQKEGLSRWAEILYPGGVINSLVSDLPIEERAGVVSEQAQALIVVPVFVGQQWWGFIGFEDYALGQMVSQAEIDAFKTVAVTFGAAIRRKRTEQALELEKTKVEDKAAEIEDLARFPAEDPSPVLRIGVEGKVLYGNRAAQPLLQFWQAGEGQVVPDWWRAVIDRATGTGKPEAVDLAVGETIYSMLVVPIQNEQYVNLYGRDVTRERALAQAQTEFISMASHQLRTPLTSVRWYSELLLKKRENLTPDQVQMGEVIHKTALQLAEIVNDLLSLSRMERGKILYDSKPGNLRQLIDEVIAEMKPQVEVKQLVCQCDIDARIGEMVLDESLVREVLLNLLANAVKYTPDRGKVGLRVELVQNSFVRLTVTDTGIGIPPAEQSRVFERFFRSTKAVNAGIPGTGLGLAVAKKMVEQWGGAIGFESVENQGTTFTFTIPLTNLS